MAGLDHADPPEVPPIAVACDRNTAQAIRRNPQSIKVMRFCHLGHRTRGFARRDKISRPDNGGGNNGGKDDAGCAAATAVR